MKRYLKLVVLPFLLFKLNISFGQSIDSLSHRCDTNALKSIDGEQVIIMANPMPEFPGGDGAMIEYIRSEFKYPEGKTHFQGRIFSTFIVDKNGNVRNACIIQSKTTKGDPKSAELEVLRLISKMPKWNPGRLNGSPVNVRYSLPISL